MSVINDMLRDLDRRNATGAAGTVLSRKLRPANGAAAAKKREKRVLVVAVASALAAFVYVGVPRLTAPAADTTLGTDPGLPGKAAPKGPFGNGGPLRLPGDPTGAGDTTPAPVPEIAAKPSSPAPATAPTATPPTSPAATATSTTPPPPVIAAAPASPSTATASTPPAPAVPPAVPPASPSPPTASAPPVAPASPVPAAPTAMPPRVRDAGHASLVQSPVAAPIAPTPGTSPRTTDARVGDTRPTPVAARRAAPAGAVGSATDDLVVESAPATRPVAIAPAPAASRDAAALPDADVIQKRINVTPRRTADGFVSQAVAVLNQGRVNEAIDHLRAALAADAGHETARQTLAALLVEQKRLGEAQAMLAEGLQANPSNVGFALLAARVALEEGNPAIAASILRRHAAAGRDNAIFRALAGNVFARTGKHDEAVVEYTEALRLAPTSGVWWTGLAMSQQALGARTEALAAYEQALATGSLSREVATFVEQRVKTLR